jgi:hypothetical protein
MTRHNERGLITIVHLPLQDIISGRIETANVRFARGDLCGTIRSNLERFIEASSKDGEALSD